METYGRLCRYLHNLPYADILEMPIFAFWNIGFTGLYKYIGISYYRDVISHYYSISFDEYETIYEISDVDDKNTV
mgnify:CR=1 FL=1